MKQHLESHPGTTDWNAMLPDALRQPFRFANVFFGCGCELRFPTQHSTADGVRVARLHSPQYYHLEDVRCGYTKSVWVSSARLGAAPQRNSSGRHVVDLSGEQAGGRPSNCFVQGESVELIGSFFSVDELVIEEPR